MTQKISTPNIVFIGFTVALLATWGLFTTVASKMRPIADDYCIGSLTLENGVFESIAWWFMNWQGDYITVTLTFLIVGIPLAFLPLELASATSFMIVSGTMWLLGTTYFNQTAIFERNQKLKATLLGSLLPISWLSFWWAITLVVTNDVTLQGPRAITNWQGINTSYVLPILIVSVWLMRLSKKTDLGVAAISLNALALGSFVGGSGLVVGLVGSLIGLAFFATTLLTSRRRAQRTLTTPLFPGIFFASNAVGWLVAYSAPGVKIRGLHFQHLENPSLQQLIDGARWALSEWVSVVFAPGTLFVLVTFFLVGTFSRTTEANSHRNWLSVAALIFVSSAFVNVVAQSASNFSYDAFWHLTPTYLLIFLATALAANQLGIVVGKAIGHRGFKSRVVACLMIFMICLTVLNTALNDTSNRLASWEKGPAPFPGIADIENTDVVYGIRDQSDTEVGFLGCWNDLGSNREIPVRTSDTAD